MTLSAGTAAAQEVNLGPSQPGHHGPSSPHGAQPSALSSQLKWKLGNQEDLENN